MRSAPVCFHDIGQCLNVAVKHRLICRPVWSLERVDFQPVEEIVSMTFAIESVHLTEYHLVDQMDASSLGPIKRHK